MIYIGNHILFIMNGIGLIFISYKDLRENLDLNKKQSIGMVLLSAGVLITSTFRLENKYGINSYSIQLLILIYILIMITIQDLIDQTIRMNWIILGGVIGLVFLLYNPNSKFLEEIISAGIFFVSILAISKITKGGIGVGDGFVISIICLVAGWKMTLTVLILGLSLSGMIGILLFIFKKVNKNTTIPFMPFILIVTLLVLWI